MNIHMYIFLSLTLSINFKINHAARFSLLICRFIFFYSFGGIIVWERIKDLNIFNFFMTNAFFQPTMKVALLCKVVFRTSNPCSKKALALFSKTKVGTESFSIRIGWFVAWLNFRILILSY